MPTRSGEICWFPEERHILPGSLSKVPKINQVPLKTGRGCPSTFKPGQINSLLMFYYFIYLAKNEHVDSKKGTISIGTYSFQPLVFKGYPLVFGDVYYSMIMISSLKSRLVGRLLNIPR